MTFEEYLSKLGFLRNPFQQSNADKEIDFLSEYFIKPDYFEDVWGNPYNPSSNIVYAPRGGGKTAQRIMIEKRAKNHSDILTITYTNHDLSCYKSVDDIDLSYHLTYLNRLLLLAFFNRITDPGFNFDFTFSFSERQYIYKIARIYLFDTPASFPNQAMSSLKKIEDYAIDLWNNFKEPIVNVIKQISKSKGLEIDLSSIEIDKKLQQSHKDNFFNIIELLKKTEYKSIIILIDKVDEQSLTGNNPENSFKFISPLLKDLELLETPNVSFKFFLWDSLKPYSTIAARPDRIVSFDLKWETKQLVTMLNKRVESYSRGKVYDFSKMFKDLRSLGRIILFSELSPRDCVRICFRIMSEQFKYNPKDFLFNESVVNNSLRMFSIDKTSELILNKSNLAHLHKTGCVSFTIEELVSNKVAADTPAIRNIINPWTTSEYLKKIGLVSRKNAKSVNEYAFQDVRIAYSTCLNLDIDTFIKQKVRKCPNCKTFFYRDFNKKSYNCPSCNTSIE
ncbi:MULTISPECIES: P-loop ATPase, Sll1717 family [Bacteroides]|jgi:hypothetical protein|uniref:Uncharacterized protein n=2 Tax=root TaxID=1 RepID=A0A413JX83_BACFG|nr:MULTISPECIES: hypothetical protein [Bacteroides]DAD88004.1 MAG TPA: alpha-aminoadipate carrier protein [Siphoviridae sp. ctYJD4]MBY2893792.1 hypothetical protein [Bacteroides fragilis]MCM0223708.1 hypothetical protein [Bacteroides fragilis]MCM0361194.1 hypothetical protein [Bacteroides fragilis]MCS2271533.1 hypothetical protein [Bacteroides fragilis]